MSQAFTEDEIADFLAQLDGWRRTLSTRQQRILDALLEAAAGEGAAGIEPDVEGFQWRPEHAGQPWLVEPRRVARVLRRAAEPDS